MNSKARKVTKNYKEEETKNIAPQALDAKAETQPIDHEACADSQDASEDRPLIAEKKRRFRMTRDQLVALEAEWYANSNWTRERVTEIARRFGIGRTKVYKWGWDRKKK